MIYFIADTHFDDANIKMYCRPEFCSVEEMNSCIIKNWNDTVTDEDVVDHLGDIGRISFLSELKGEIRVIKGNHDDEMAFREAYPNMRFYDKPIIDGFMILSHEPISFIPKEAPFLNIHGHLHQFEYRCGNSLDWYEGNRYFSVSCELIGYKPISLDEIIQKIGYKELK